MDVMRIRLPAVNASEEAFRVGVGSRRQFYKTIGARQAQEVSRSIRRPRICPGTAPVVVLDDDGQEIRQLGFEGYRRGQGQPLGRRALGAHRFGDGRNDIADQAHESGDRIAGQSKYGLALWTDAKPHRSARPLCNVMKYFLHTKLHEYLGTRSNLPIDTPPLKTTTSWVVRCSARR